MNAHDPLCPLVKLSVLKSGCPQCNLIAIGREAGYATGYGAAMDDGWGEPGHIEAAYAKGRADALAEGAAS